jgi:hypothetical protein
LIPEERGRVARELEEVSLQLKQPLCASGERIDSVYFPVRSIVSVLTRAQGTTGVEVATIGNEGLVGVSLSWGAATQSGRTPPGSGTGNRIANAC